MAESNNSQFTTLGSTVPLPSFDLPGLGTLITLYGNDFAVRGRAYTFYAHCKDFELNDRDPLEPPVIEVASMQGCARTVYARGEMLNCVDNTATVNGPLYHFTLVLPADTSLHSVEAHVVDYGAANQAANNLNQTLTVDPLNLVAVVTDMANMLTAPGFVENLTNIEPATDTMHLVFSDALNDELHDITSMTGSQGPDHADGCEQWFTNDTAANTWTISGIGRPLADLTAFTITVDGTAYDMLSHANATVLTNGDWSFTVPGGIPAAEGSYSVLTNVSSTANGNVYIGGDCGWLTVDRTAPALTFAWGLQSDGLTALHGDKDTNPGDPAKVGEYLRWTYDATDTYLRDVTVTESSGGNWLNGQTGAWADAQRDSGWGRIGNVSAGDKKLQAVARDWAGNTTTVEITAEVIAGDAAPTLTVTPTSDNQSPRTLNNQQFAHTSYDDNTIAADITLSAAMEDCRNSGIDNTSVRLQSGTLGISAQTQNNAADLTSFSYSRAVNSQASALGLNVQGRADTQHYQSATANSPAVWDYNAEKINDLGTSGTGSPAGGSDPTLVSPFAGLNSIRYETFHDAEQGRSSATPQYDGSGIESQSAVAILGGFAKPGAAGAELICNVQLDTNNVTNTQYGIKLRGPAGEVGAANGLAVAWGTSPTGPWNTVTPGAIFTGPAGAAELFVRVTWANTTTDVEAVYVGYIE